MQEHGFEWNHNTVLKTESAKRPVRLTEATTLASILEVSVFSLMQPELDETKAALREEMTILSASHMRAIDTAQRLRDVFQQARHQAEEASAAVERAEAGYSAAMEQVEEIGGQIRRLDARLADPNPLSGES